MKLDLICAQFLKCSLECFNRTLYVTFDDDIEIGDLTFLDLLIEVLECDLVPSASLSKPFKLLTLLPSWPASRPL